ncbi:hypothetical protein D3P96_00895 [Weissella viridescens]|uniref:Uncharacterized protein n=2 Tax=Weissella viridescens TaxID=1629 RepID=A0A3P2RGU9_WEIVI|nr:hypothetical protein D3P96_00895 [Weissella viridescens]
MVISRYLNWIYLFLGLSLVFSLMLWQDTTHFYRFECACFTGTCLFASKEMTPRGWHIAAASVAVVNLVYAVQLGYPVGPAEVHTMIAGVCFLLVGLISIKLVK